MSEHEKNHFMSSNPLNQKPNSRTPIFFIIGFLKKKEREVRKQKCGEKRRKKEGCFTFSLKNFSEVRVRAPSNESKYRESDL